ncbi:MAG TPA: hypothetical protein VMM84_00480 [Pyrinomonadaceae bacterium]|nr:hypothetical protein [Pyrinomonadaceae bacterium]
MFNLHGIPKPTYRAFELLHNIGTEQSLVDGLHETVDCSVIRNESSVTVLLTNHTTPGHSIETERIEVRLDNAPEPRQAHIQRIDSKHANPKAFWLDMGQPEYLTQQDIERLQEASRLLKERQSFRYKDGAVVLKLDLPPYAVAAITLEVRSDMSKHSR